MEADRTRVIRSGGGRIKTRAFWCPLVSRWVEVECLDKGLPGFRRPFSVLRCSAFEDPTVVTCDRRCLDEAYWLRRPFSTFGGVAP